MTQNSTTTNRVDQLQALGAQLRAAREAQAYSVAEVAERLYLSSSQVDAIEQGNYQRLPAEVFVKGYLRSYAKLLKLDPVQILAQYQPPVEELPEDLESQQLEPRPVNPLDRLPDMPGLVVWAAIALLALLLLATIIYFTSSGGDPDQEPALAEPAVDQQSGLDANMPVIAGTDFETTGQGAVIDPNTQHLEMRFTDDCWVEVRDASRKILLADMRRAGDTEIVEGEPPYKVVLGCYEAVAVRFQGRSIPVIPDAGNKSAQMVIGG